MDVFLKVKNILEKKFADHDFEDCFVIEVDWNQKQKKLVVFIDCDRGLTLNRCQQLSRFLQSELDLLDLFEKNYILEVSSPGVDRPLKFFRQYKNNIGRTLKVHLRDGSMVKGKLQRVKEEGIVLLTRKNIKRSRKWEEAELEIKFEEIKNSFIEISFK